LSKSSDTIQYSMTGGERSEQSEEHCVWFATVRAKTD
jgi:hypothetical protein